MADTSDTNQVSVLFVCLGNICRSTMAEGVFRSLTNHTPSSTNPHPLISKIDSCGTGGYHIGAQPDSRTLDVLKNRAWIKDYKHQARKIRVAADFEEFDYILAMDAENLADLRELVSKGQKKGQLAPGAEKRVFLYGAFGGKSQNEEVGDPYYGGGEGFDIAYEQVTRFGKGLLKHIEEQADKAEG